MSLRVVGQPLKASRAHRYSSRPPAHTAFPQRPQRFELAQDEIVL
jgi:hypothetical protein